MDEMIIGALIIVVALVGLAMLGDLFLYWAKSSCFHKWNQWGEPHEGAQYRLCQKCKMVERRSL
jgi:hypothetical protein